MTERIEADVTDRRARRAGRTLRGRPDHPGRWPTGMLGSVSEADDSVQEPERISELDLMGLGA
jgi:hypothetical protein